MWWIIGGLVLLGLIIEYPIIGIILGVIIVVLFVVGRKSGTKNSDSSLPPAAQLQSRDRPTDRSKKGTDYIAVAPVLPPFFVGKVQTEQIEIVGEYYHQDAFRALIAMDVLEFSTQRYTGRGIFLLSDDSDNPYDPQAVAVWFEGQNVGYLSREDARRYRSDINRATGLGYTIATTGTIWIGVGSGFNPIAQIWLPAPGQTLPSNDIPKDAVILPDGLKIQVTKEEDHMDVLTRWVKKTHGQATILFTLKAIQDVRSRTVVDIVQVCIDDEPIGVLTKGMSEKLVPLVEYVEERAKTPVVYGELTGNSIKCEATFWCARANDVSEQWLASLGPKKVRVRHERPEPMWDDDGPVEQPNSETAKKPPRVQQDDYAPAAHPDIPDPYQGLGEESQN